MIYTRHELLRPPKSFTQTKWKDQHCIFVNDEHNTNVIQYDSDEHRRLLQICPTWELCPISNTRTYLMYGSSYDQKHKLLARSIYFDVPIRDMAVISSNAASERLLLFHVNKARTRNLSKMCMIVYFLFLNF